MSRRHYSDEERAEALAIADSCEAVAEAARQAGVPRGTLRRWLNERDRAAPAHLRHEKKREAEERWAKVEDKSLVLAEATLDGFLPEGLPPVPDKRMLLTFIKGAAIARDKVQLLTGEPTERREYTAPPVREVRLPLPEPIDQSANGHKDGRRNGHE